MKKVLIICLALITISLQAQPENNEFKHHRGERKMNMTPEQIAELKTKNMVLHLDLTEQQEKRVYSIMLNQANKREPQRENQKERGKEEMSFENRKEMLENRIEVKKELKSILTKEQFEKWETNMERKNRKHQKRKKQK